MASTSLTSLVLALSVATAQAQEPPRYTLADLEQRALASHPSIVAAKAGSEAIGQAAEQVGALPNPVVGYQGEDIQSGAPTFGGQHGLFMEQTIPLGGKLRVRRDVLLQQRRTADVGIELARQRVRFALRTAYAESLVAAERVRVAESLEATLNESVQTTRQLYNIGLADRPDLLQVEADSARAALSARTARADREAAWIALTLAVGDLAFPRGTLEGSVTEPPMLDDHATAWQTFRQESPQFTETARSLDVANAVVARERAGSSPDLLLRGGALYDRARDSGGSANGWEGRAEVGVSVPLWNRNRAGIAAAETEADATRARADAVALDLQRRFEAAYVAYAASADAARTYRSEILPRADQAYRLTMDRYRTMNASYVLVLTTRRSLVDATAAYVEALDQTWRQAVALQTGLLDMTE